jgi:hypothetical protein
MSLLLKWFVLFAAVLAAISPAMAEPVLIRSRSGMEGQGWLFGAPQDGKSWIVAPAHVIASPETGKLEPFFFVDAFGVAGESAEPISGAPALSETVADREARDLAFARVLVGREDGTCRSRLGMSTVAYNSAMLKVSDFKIVSCF